MSFGLQRVNLALKCWNLLLGMTGFEATTDHHNAIIGWLSQNWLLDLKESVKGRH
jgi:hypothetical protein